MVHTPVSETMFFYTEYSYSCTNESRDSNWTRDSNTWQQLNTHPCIGVMILYKCIDETMKNMLMSLYKCVDCSDDALSTQRTASDALAASLTADQVSTRQEKHGYDLIHADLAGNVTFQLFILASQLVQITAAARHFVVIHRRWFVMWWWLCAGCLWWQVWILWRRLRSSDTRRQFAITPTDRTLQLNFPVFPTWRDVTSAFFCSFFKLEDCVQKLCGVY